MHAPSDFSGTRIFAAFDSVQAVEDEHNTQVVFGQVEKRESLLVADRLWEPRLDNGYPNVYYSPSGIPRFRL
jgi:hypothetical protein